MSRRAQAALVFLMFLMAAGTVGYAWIEGWPWLDSLYMTLITVSTVGFGELRPLSPAGKLFTSALILLGVGTLAYTLTQTMEALLERRLIHWRRLQMDIKRMQNHVILCGYGRMGQTVTGHLRAREVPFVVIEKDPALGERLDQIGIFHVRGDATDEAILIAAGIRRARALATVLPHDADNLFVTITARGLVPDLTIVTRSSNEKNEAKMIAAGATRVQNPYRQGGRLMVRQLLHPSVTEFIDVISSGRETDLQLEEVQLQAGSSLAGVMLRDAPIRREMDVIVVGVRRGNEELIFNPSPDLTPRAGDILVVLGRSANLRRLEALAGGG